MNAKREKFSSRLGFILISAGCAIGLGNVWRFPYITGKYGGAAFVLIYLLFLLILGLPIMVMEFAVGRASQKSCARSFEILQPKGGHWGWFAWWGYIGCYLLMMYYTTICGWMLSYIAKNATGTFVGLDSDGVAGVFSDMLANPGELIGWMIVSTFIGLLVCSMGLQKGVERITKVMMSCLFGGIHRDIPLPAFLLLAGGGQAQGGLPGPDGQGHLLGANFQLLGQPGQGGLGAVGLQVPFPGVVHLEAQLLDGAAHLDGAPIPEKLFDLPQDDGHRIGGKQTPLPSSKPS